MPFTHGYRNRHAHLRRQFQVIRGPGFGPVRPLPVPECAQRGGTSPGPDRRKCAPAGPGDGPCSVGVAAAQAAGAAGLAARLRSSMWSVRLLARARVSFTRPRPYAAPAGQDEGARGTSAVIRGAVAIMTSSGLWLSPKSMLYMQHISSARLQQNDEHRKLPRCLWH